MIDHLIAFFAATLLISGSVVIAALAGTMVVQMIRMVREK